ncbi:NAD-dependent epimerase/dehydratase family protein [Desulfosporosinus sp. FKA]|uniref:NAD-dependent epimerase/dehydratase family protein n=1 Tax=Desulfosporosinus sp. FKA TaxID=1969834 RepID=UPI000B499009|nr:NAD-dependent epimerase/dehydratase family protein [Desulfosporosinus sp. FKA]
MKVLFIGGNGNISWWCVNETLKLGYEVSVLNRQETVSTRRDVHTGVTKIKADIRNFEEAKSVLKNCEFDVVCDFIVRNDKDADNAYELFHNRVKQYFFISSESVYQRTGNLLPLKETAPLYNLDEVRSDYVRGKVLAEIAFQNYCEKKNFPVTIVRPSYTYDTIIPSSIGGNCWTVIKFAKERSVFYIGGDGYALRTFTHSEDFARAFVHLVGNAAAIGQDYHIASDDWLTWNEATEIIADVFEIAHPKIIHLNPNYVLNSSFGKQEDLARQKMYHLIYDCGKIKSVAKGWHADISLSDGLQRTKEWLEERPAYKRVDKNLYSDLENLVSKGEKNVSRVCPVCGHSESETLYELCQNMAIMGGGFPSVKSRLQT